jgi:hypothetical protein
VGDPGARTLRIRESWFNTAAFAQQAAGTFDSAGRNILGGPCQTWFYTSLFENFPLGETMRLQFRPEAFNISTPHASTSRAAQLSTPDFGVITSAQDPRIVQFR